MSLSRDRKPNEHGDGGPRNRTGWASAAELSRGHIGSTQWIGDRLRHLREELLDDLVAAGFSRNDAVSAISDHLIGPRKLARGREGLVASSDAVRLLSLRPRDEAAPPKPTDWQSAIELTRKHANSCVTIAKRLDSLRASLVDIFCDAGCSEEDAAAIVKEYFVGIRKPSSGQETIAASPMAVVLAESLGLLTPRAMPPHLSRG